MVRSFQKSILQLLCYLQILRISLKYRKSLQPRNVVDEINYFFKAFDQICEEFEVEKIKTIGDAYMAVSSIGKETHLSTKKIVLAALKMSDVVTKRQNDNPLADKVSFQMRIGLHTGPIVAGVVGVKKFQYDIWGDTVNIASRIESNGEINRVNISQASYDFIKEDPAFVFEYRGKVMTKGKGEIEMYFVNSKNS